MEKILGRLKHVFPLAAVIFLMMTGRGNSTMAVTAPQDLGAGAEVVAENEAPPASLFPLIRIDVNIPATEMTVYENEVPVFVKRVAIGSGVYPTPEQESEIRRIEWNPWWYPPPGAKWAAGEKPHPPGKGNPLGQIKMPISSAILFHGTNKEWTVGRPASHGCMRMYNADAEELGWYLQSRLSQKTDPALKEVYKKHSGTTYAVSLDAPVPVRLLYRPIVVRDDAVVLYPDYYNRLGKKNKKALLLGEMVASGVAIESIDDAKINALIKKWPSKATETPLMMLLLSAGEGLAFGDEVETQPEHRPPPRH